MIFHCRSGARTLANAARLAAKAADLRRLHRRGRAGCLEESRPPIGRDRPPPASRTAAPSPDRRRFPRLPRDAARASRLALVPCRAAVCRRRAHPRRRDRILRHGPAARAGAVEPRAAYAPKAVGTNRLLRRPDTTVRSCDDGLILGPSGLGLFSGSLVGFSLGLVGGGGSILAVPLLIYLVGVGTRISRSARARLRSRSMPPPTFSHARAGNVKWRCASVYALAGVAGAFFGRRSARWSTARSCSCCLRC